MKRINDKKDDSSNQKKIDTVMEVAMVFVGIMGMSLMAHLFKNFPSTGGRSKGGSNGGKCSQITTPGGNIVQETLSIVANSPNVTKKKLVSDSGEVYYAYII